MWVDGNKTCARVKAHARIPEKAPIPERGYKTEKKDSYVDCPTHCSYHPLPLDLQPSFKTHTPVWVAQGKFEFANGDVYNGDWVNNRRNGRGRCEYHTGEVYDGEWKDDVRAGAGDETIPRDDSDSSGKGLHETAALSGTLRVWPEPSRPRVPEAA